ncbi:MAG: pilus assembly protein N-terminal domain-containing protein [Candidatus Hydrogenedentota bacterium]
MKKTLALLILMASFALSGAAQQLSSANPSRPTRDIPDVYVSVNNSFIITVPNLAKVAVGNPNVVDVRVISPTEVLVQGQPSLAAFFGGFGGAAAATEIGVATTEVYVWSGEQRYVYRVVVIDNSNARAFPIGVTRIDVEPNRVILHGQTSDMARTIAQAEQIFQSRGIKYELKVTTAPTASRLFRGLQVDTALIEKAIERGYVIEGMSLEEVRQSQKTMPPVLRTEMRDSVPVDIYRFPAVDIVVDEGTVIEVRARDLAREDVIAAAIENHLILEGMTIAEMEQSIGKPSSPPTAQAEGGAIVYTYSYPLMRVRVRDGRIIEIQSTSPTMPLEGPPTGQRMPLVRIGGTEFVGRAYRFKYITGADIVSVLSQLNASGAGLNYRTVGYSDEGSLMIYADTGTIAFIDNVVAFTDRPKPQSLITIDSSVYTVPGQRVFDPTLGIMVTQPARQVGFLIGRFSPMIDDDRRRAIIDELRAAVARLPEVPNQTPLSLAFEGGTLTMNGPPEQVALLQKTLLDMLPRYIDADVLQALEERVLLTGMTRAQVEAALGYALDTTPLRTIENGDLYLSYDLGNRMLRFRQDVLTEIQMYPGSDDVRNAILRKQLTPNLLRSDVEKILGDRPLRVTANADGTQTVKYDFGDALYFHDRLIRFDNLAGSEIVRRGVSVAVPYASGTEFQMLTPEEQLTVIEGGSVMQGMTERDVARVLGGAPFAIRPGDRSNEKVYTYSEYVITFRDGVVVDVRQTGDNSPRIITMKSRGAADIANLIGRAYPDVPGLSITLDSVSNRLIIRAPNDRFAEIERFAKTMDQGAIQQVLIEAKFVEINRTIIKQLGIDWGLSTVNQTTGNRPFAGYSPSGSASAITGDPADPLGTTNPILGNGILFGMLGARSFNLNGMRFSNIDVLINALESSNDAEVLSSPRIVTVNNQSARLQSIDRVFDISTTTTVTDGGGISTSTEATPVDIGITLDVNPTIGQNGIISLDLEAIVSRPNGEPREFGEGTSTFTVVNNVSERNARTRVMVRSGTPLVIGGLSSRAKTGAASKVPILGDIPWLGKLFQSDQNTVQDVDLLIFLTTRVIPADGTISEVDQVVGGPRTDIPNPAPTVTKPSSTAATPATAGR